MLNLDPSWGEELIAAIEKRVGPRQPIAERGKAVSNPGVIMKCEDLEMMIEVVGHPLALTDRDLHLILFL